MPKSYLAELKSRFHHRSLQLENRTGVRSALSLGISSLHFFFWEFLNEEIYADNSKKINELKDAHR